MTSEKFLRGVPCLPVHAQEIPASDINPYIAFAALRAPLFLRPRLTNGKLITFRLRKRLRNRDAKSLPVSVRTSRHNAEIGVIDFSMFIDEILDRFGIEDAFAPFTVNIIGNGHVVISGIKSVTFSSASEVCVRFSKGGLKVTGENLLIVQIGGGDAYVKGDVKGVELD